ncbi:hypothetical protein O3299_05635 [Janthinobacterium sp. SUN176]|uniref:Uncharacterized protein n=1 Tax=Janthinobacterium kumbetense TaxID=2950280 RepID=A0ABT0WM05_9BURK|nr:MULTISPECIES: hypothetical protein [Janthinobacterium]MCM2565101.1 hypothetical protein [Janthinobacterium kumbetense]MDO8070997.1 hypothetical protein [Janthinobacterium sp. SUN176]
MHMHTDTVYGKKIKAQGRRFLSTYDISGITIEKWKFENCAFGYNSIPFSKKRDSIRNSELIDCKLSKCLMGPAEIHTTRICDLSGDMLICWGTLFDQVVLEGKISPLILHGLPNSNPDVTIKEAHHSKAKNFYAVVPWALDISEAKFEDFSIRTGAIPLSLVRRDINSQFLVRNVEERLSRSNIDALPVSRYTKVVLEIMTDEGLDETLLVAPKLDKPLYSQVLHDAEVLAKNGLLV